MTYASVFDGVSGAPLVDLMTDVLDRPNLFAILRIDMPVCLSLQIARYCDFGPSTSGHALFN